MAQNVYKVGQRLIFKSMTNLLFPHENLLHKKFLQTDLGQLYLSIPFDELSMTIEPPAQSKSGKGCRPWFDVRGGIALRFLKHYLGLSDDMLIRRINTDWSLQYFCGIQLKPTKVIKDVNLPSYWRGYIGNHLDIKSMQHILARHWEKDMEHTHISGEDATCYESRISYPTPDILEQNKTGVTQKQACQLRIINTVYAQQHSKVYEEVEQIKDRIISLSKPYIRPIVCGKETKAVEFGAKVNKLQVDGISFIEHFSYDAFNEGTRLHNCICLHRELFGKSTHFGNEKNHYLLQKVNVRNATTEKCWIFFGMMTANASIITNRKQEEAKQKQAA